MYALLPVFEVGRISAHVAGHMMVVPPLSSTLGGLSGPKTNTSFDGVKVMAKNLPLVVRVPERAECLKGTLIDRRAELRERLSLFRKGSSQLQTLCSQTQGVVFLV